MKTIAELKTLIDNKPARSAWDKAVKIYARELIDELDDAAEFYGSPADKKTLLNGADNWAQYSEGGCSLVYDGDIAERLCSPSELKKVKGGDRNPNSRENWIEAQARALHQASSMIMHLAR